MRNHYEILSNRTSKRKRIYDHLERINAEYKMTDVMAPVTLEIFPTNNCNSKCRFCAYPKTDADFLSDEQLQEITSFCTEYEIKGVVFSGGGEPTTHPGLPEAIRKLTDEHIGVGLITNGINISDELMESLSKCKWVRFSLLSPDADRYKNLTGMKNDIFEKVKENIRRVSEKSENLIIGATLLISQDINFINEMERYVDLASEIGIDQIFLSEMVSGIGKYKLDRDIFGRYVDKIRRLCEDKKIVTNLDKFVNGKSGSSQRYEGEQCHYIQKNLGDLITANGNVYPCLGLADQWGCNPLGRMKEQPLREILTKRNIENYYNIVKDRMCRFCKNANTRKELDRYLCMGTGGYCRDEHSMFL